MKAGDLVQVNFPPSVAELGALWLPAKIAELNGAGVVAVPLTPHTLFPNGQPRMTLSFPPDGVRWRM